MLYGAGTWTFTLEHENLIRLKLRKCKQEGKHKSKNKENRKFQDMTDDERSSCDPHTESEYGRSTSIGHDQDINVSMEDDADDSASRADEEEEDLIDVRRNTREAEEKCEKNNITCWIETQGKLK